MKPTLHVLLALAALALAGCPKKKEPEPSGVVDPSAQNVVSAAARARIRTTLVEIEKACTSYNASQGQFPADLQALIDGGQWLDQNRADPWGHDWVIVSEGSQVTVYCYGRDGAPGGEGEDADWSSH